MSSSPATTTEPALAASPFEIASNVVVGASSLRLEECVAATTPIGALEDAVRPALQRGRCFVSFSGGHDSSLVLGVATRVAQAEGFDLPIPITLRFLDAPRAEESQVQNDVVAALGLRDWVQLTADDQLDYVGPVAQQVLLRHGVLYPANAFLHAPLFTRAAGGTVLTGVGGDQLFNQTARPRRPWPAAPRSGRHEGYPWLRPSAARRALRNVAREARRMPRDPAARPGWRLARRRLELGRQSRALIAGDADTRVEDPLLDRALLRAVAQAGGWSNVAGGRTARLARLFADHVPPACLLHRPKAVFNEVLWKRHSRAHLDAWDGSGVDERIVDVDGLRAWWKRDQSMMYTALLAQQTWLAGHAAGTRAATMDEPSESRAS